MYLETKSVRQVENFNLDWFFCHTDCNFTPGEPPTKDFRPVKLPHDWSLEYPFNENADSCGCLLYTSDAADE